MKIISELETTCRGAYCGCIGYIGFDGMMDTNILIRTAIIQNQSIHFSVGSGITAQSHPQQEYAETLHKAKALFLALSCRKVNMSIKMILFRNYDRF